MIDPVYGSIVFAAGLIVGSFLNVCIVRWPHENSVIKPRSHCVKCKKTIPWYDNIPIFSYLILKGRCRSCGEKISPRYLFVELLTAFSFVGFYAYFGWERILIPYLVFLCCLIIATFVDFEHRIIPDEVTIGGLFVGLIFSAFMPEMHDVQMKGFIATELSTGRSALGVLIGGGIIYGIGLLGDFIFKKESMGGGDVKFLAMVGAFLGWKLAILSLLISPFFGSIYGIVEKIRTGDSAIAYGPFLVIGALISLFLGDQILHFIFWGNLNTP